MLALQTQSRIVPKLMKMADGRIALVHFLVSFENGAIKARILSVRFSGEQTSFTQDCPLSLCGVSEKAGEIFSQQNYYTSVVSPYVQLSFFVSQPTRAPAYIKAQI